MNEYSIVYLGPFDRAPFFGGSFWFDKDVPQAVRGDLAAQLLFTKTTDGGQQFQLASEADFNGMLFDGFIAAGTSIDGLIWAGALAVAPAASALLPTGGAGDPSQAAAAILGDAQPTDVVVDGASDAAAIDETVDGAGDAAGGDSAPAATTRSTRRARNGSNASNTGAQA
jgi:hypothetical protein